MLCAGTHRGYGVQYEVVEEVAGCPDGGELEVKDEVLVDLIMNRRDKVRDRKTRRKDLERPEEYPSDSGISEDVAEKRTRPAREYRSNEYRY